MAQTTANLVGSILTNMEIPEAITISSHENDGDLTAVGGQMEDQMLPPAGGSTAVSGGQTVVNNSNMPNKNWRSKAKNIHRIVEQIDQEPMGIVIFKWCLILIGSVMLGVVLFLTGEVIYAWSSGELKHQQELALANLANLRSNKTKDFPEP